MTKSAPASIIFLAMILVSRSGIEISSVPQCTDTTKFLVSLFFLTSLMSSKSKSLGPYT